VEPAPAVVAPEDVDPEVADPLAADPVELGVDVEALG
jgi:hypothetical protein